MATVYLAEDVKHRRKVAIKVLKPELAIALGPERFLREIDIAAKLTHPHILPLLDSGEAESSLYYVMPYVSGDSLRQRLERESQLKVEEAVRLTSEVASALDYAHRSGVVHRDVKPENILLVDGHAVVADFGIARAISRAGGDTLTSMGLALGTPAYMSPEQASAEREVDGRSDVYSLGCVLYEMLAGEPPFTGRNALAIIAKRMSQPVPSVRVVREGVPDGLDRVVRRALSRSPADRYDTADALCRALKTAADATFQDVDADSGNATSRRTTSPTTATRPRRREPRRVESIAVLPFQNLSRDAQQEYFVDAMHDAIIAQLAQIGGLRVTSRTSVAHYKASTKTVQEIARELKVDAVMEGSVLSAGDSVRIHVELIRPGPRERYLWGQTYDRNVRDVLALHSEVARAVAKEIRVALTPEELTRLGKSRPVNPEAYRHYLVGNFHLGKWTESAFRQALDNYQQAIAIDPDYAPAYAGQAMAYIELGSWASTLPPAAVSAQAKAAALAAIERDPMLAEGHIALAQIKQLFEWDWAGAEAEYSRGIALNPSAAHALLIYGNYLMTLGRFEQAGTIARRAVELDPLSAYAIFQVGWALDHLRRDDEALADYEKGMELAPNDASQLLELAAFHGERGRIDVASGYAERAESLLGAGAAPAWLGRLGYGYGIAKRPADARRILNRLMTLAEHEYVPPTCLAVICAVLGETETAIDLLEEAYEKRDVIMVWLRARHGFDPLRAHPRFQDLLRRMNFPD
jgi:serine/threonine-protein kinase